MHVPSSSQAGKRKNQYYHCYHRHCYHYCYCYYYTVIIVDAFLGLEWKTFNAAQKQARRDMLPLYQTKRPLLAGRFSLNASEHLFGPMFTVQV